MACGCRGGQRAGAPAAGGGTIQGYEVTYPAGSGLEPKTFLTALEAKKEIRRYGGGTARQIVSGG